MDLIELRRLPYAAFDFDGTLADSNTAFIRFCETCFQEAGQELTPEFLERVKVMGLPELCTALSRELIIWSREKMEQKLLAFTDDFYRRRVTLKPFAREYLRALQADGVRLCVLSATEERLIRMALVHLGLEDCFLFVAAPEQVGGRSKGFPDIFQYTCRRFGCPDIGRIAMYDDSLEALRTARSAGMATIGVYDDASAGTADEIRAVCDGYIMGFGELLQA